MSNGGSIVDSIQGLFSSSGGGSRDAREGERDPVRDRMERVEQIASGVRMAADALTDETKELKRESKETAGSVLEAARGRVPDGDGGSGSAGREAVEELSRCVDALEELHYRLLQIEVHPEVQSEEERERAAERAREALRRAREAADSLAGATAA